MKSEIKLNSNYLIKQLPKATAYVGLNFEVIYISDSWKNNFGPFQTEIVGSNILCNFPSLSQKWQTDFEKCFSGCASTNNTSIYSSKQKNSWLEWSITPWYDERENSIGAIIQIEDVTTSIKTQQELEKLKILINVKSEIARIGSWEFNAVTSELTWCKMTKLIHEVPSGFKPNIKMALKFYKPGYNQNKISEIVEKGIHNGESWNEKLQLITAKNREIWVIATGKPIFEDGKYIGIIGTLQDITEVVAIAQKTKESEHLLKTLIDNLPVNIFIKDLDSKKILVNKSEANFIGLPSEEIIGKDDFDHYDQKTAQFAREQDLRVMRSLKPILGEETINIQKNGLKTTLLTSKIPLFDDNYKIKGIVGFSLDISHIKQKEEELRRHINISNLQNKKLVNFAHIISHNLRSHTANFSMLLGFLIKEKEELERENLLTMLMNSSDNLLETLDNLNEVVAINTKVNLEIGTVNLNTKIKTIIKSLNYLIKNKKTIIVIQIPEFLNLKGSPAYIENILLNVISNAIKFAKSDIDHCVEISAEKFKNHIVVTVKDNGFGIDLEKNKEKLFGMYKTFHQQPNSKGIGLYIAKNQIEAMNGKFYLESKVGVGTTFKIFFNDND